MLSQIYKANRELFARLYPTTLVFKDGSSITVKFHEPRKIIRMPLTLDDCATQADKTAWQIRRRQVNAQKIDSDADDVKFDRSKYIRALR